MISDEATLFLINTLDFNCWVIFFLLNSKTLFINRRLKCGQTAKRVVKAYDVLQFLRWCECTTSEVILTKKKYMYRDVEY